VLTPLTNFRVHPVYTWVFTNILAFSAAFANGFGNYMFGETAYQYAMSDTEHHPGAVHSRLCAPPAFAHVDRVPRRPGAHLRQPRASSGTSLGQSETLQQKLRLVPCAVGLDVRHALRAGKETRALTFGFSGQPDAHTLKGELVDPFINAAGHIWPKRPEDVSALLVAERKQA
jgi:hypothetical protein